MNNKHKSVAVSDDVPSGVPSENLSTGTIFKESGVLSQEVLHWKRALIGQIYPFALFVLDLLLISIVFAIVVSLRYEVSLFQAMSRRVLLVIICASVMGLYLIGGYNYQTNKSTFRFISEHIIVSAGVFVGVFFVIYSFVTYGFQINSGRSIVAATLLIFPAISITYRYCLSRIKASYQRGNALCVIGSGWAAEDVYHRLKQRKSTYEIIIVDPDEACTGNQLIEDDPTSPVIEPLENVSMNSSMHGRYVESYVVACPTDDLPSGFLKKLAVAHFNGNNVCSYEAFLREKLMMIPPSEVSMAWALEEGFLLNKNMTYDRVKRLGDILFAVGGLVILSPLFLITTLLVKLTSRGPIIFKQVRVGKREEPFMLYKFRSMKVGAEKGDKYTAKNDSRLTVVGKFLRKTRLDELPQFWNVLKGDLSLIGPRAEWIDLVKNYEKKFPYYHFRHAVKPGITGWAQVNYSYGASEKDTLEKLYYDLYYVRKHSFLLDAIIVVKTIYIVLFGRGQ